jgi:hypothetical protein
MDMPVLTGRTSAAAILALLGIFAFSGFGGASRETALKLNDVKQALRAAGVTSFATVHTPGPSSASSDYFIEPNGPAPGAKYLYVFMWLTVQGATTTTYLQHAEHAYPKEHVLDRRVCNVWLMQNTPPVPSTRAPASARQRYARLLAETKLAEGRIGLQLQRRCGA